MNVLNQLKKLWKTAEVVSVVFEASTDIQSLDAQAFILKSVPVDHDLPGGKSDGFTGVDSDSINLSKNNTFANIFLGNYSDISTYQKLVSSGYKSGIVRDFLTSITLLALVLGNNRFSSIDASGSVVLARPNIFNDSLLIDSTSI
ncbi:MAG: hypothetical protein CLLPBCKN_008417 [Chroococcidiopsis cubana SAG 39.79]|uniref:DUF4347 domain-containing protein n=1 Tax=Chroococcidiopsis cubana SAG 39.79 TaxID=388085 RepID=A0AB37UDT8_9CYAN|nr:hypothetical protein [Chroococcidiopsis cubana]MDZ4876697.1 hypothetical protein [Chroococcidiopsis cubana SAG 39.79]MDZ4878979.1 hypothetical protein [Chroococcidiopsis cubana SAG 39.79]PSB55728.1 hypothetical protein C7B79_33145 [Chroococcidiopsis cubana CCALA 043]RUT06382.1 hypothetical protein DSM107010_52650 [Chroococcidiopsis cubana SAG 39.79]